MHGFELSKGDYVQITEEELESLEAEANSAIEFREFVPVEKLDSAYFESTYYLAPSNPELVLVCAATVPSRNGEK